MTDSAFASFQKKAWPYSFRGTLHVPTIAGGTPTDQHVAEGWLRTKLADKDDLIREQVAEIMVERGVNAEEATAIADTMKHLNGFKRDDQGLYIEGRQLKAAIKEAASVAYAAGKLLNNGKNAWGKTSKGILGFVAEHVCVVEDRLHLGVHEATGIMQRFVHTYRGTGIQYEEYVSDAEIAFTIATDHKFTAQQWAMIWLTGEQQGIGASRSQGFGRYTVTSWEEGRRSKPLAAVSA
jgi:hypothetical protein